jgi:pyruvate carboxylase subunit B
MGTRLKITETALRDAHQSLLATRMKTEDMVPILSKMDKVGYYSVEMWGGATFDTCIRFLKEDPWERLRIIRREMPNTKLQMLLRGQNLLGYRHYPDDVVEKFVEKSAENGIDIFRIFDALNDTRNLKTAIRAVKKVKKHAQGAICYTISPVHTIQKFIDLAKELVDLGVDSICIKDMAGLLSPYDAYELISKLKEEIKIPIQLHTHATSGFALMTMMKSIEAGVDIVDTAISSLSLGTSHPPTEVIVAALKGRERDTGLDLHLLREISDYFADVRKKYKEFESKFVGCDISVLVYQIPGGMLSNMERQLKEQNALDKLPLIFKEVPEVRKDLGYPPLVTPTSQIVGTQAVLNVITGERYKIVTKETKDLVRGMYGKPPGEISEEIRKKILGDEKPITVRPADLLEPEFEKKKKELGEDKSDEDVLTYILFPEVAKKFFEERDKKPVEVKREEVKRVEKIPAKEVPFPRRASYRVSVGGRTFIVEVEEMGSSEMPSLEKAQPKKEEKREEPVSGIPVSSPVSGKVLRIPKKEGDVVEMDEVIIVLEAFKMEMNVKSPAKGRIKKLLCKEGDDVKTGDLLAILEGLQ